MPHYSTLHYTTLLYTTPHYTALHYTTLHYIQLHYYTARHHTSLHSCKRAHGATVVMGRRRQQGTASRGASRLVGRAGILQHPKQPSSLKVLGLRGCVRPVMCRVRAARKAVAPSGCRKAGTVCFGSGAKPRKRTVKSGFFKKNTWDSLFFT